jgi:WD40 repeat protein
VAFSANRFAFTHGDRLHILHLGKRTSLTFSNAADVEFSPDGKLLVVGSHAAPGKIALVEVAQGKVRGLLWPGEFLNTVHDLTFSSDSKKIAAAGHFALGVGEGLAIWDFGGATSGWADVLPIAESVRFSPDGKRLIAGLQSGEVVLLDATSRHSLQSSRWPQYTSEPGRYVTAVAFSEDGKLIAAGTYGGDVRLWRILR